MRALTRLKASRRVPIPAAAAIARSATASI
jgi:hypothetical protein